MDEVKISVLIPLYNRKIYAEDCIKNVLNQTFQDFEILIRDDFSTDGVLEFVQEEFSKPISEGKIKIFRNEKNLGEAVTCKKLFEDATGKYVTVLHNDDLYLPNALEHLFEVAEKYSADVVHGSNFLTSDKDGKVSKGASLRKVCLESNPAKNIMLMPEDLNSRFSEWRSGGTFQDLQYDIFKRQFILDSEILEGIESSNTFLFSLIWIMKAKIFVKTPEIFYIRRDSPFSQTNNKTISSERLEKTILSKLNVLKQVDKFVSEFDFFRENKDYQYFVKAKIFMAEECLGFKTEKAIGKKNYAELYHSTEKIFKKYFGDDGVYLALLYHWAHIMQFNKSNLQKILLRCLNLTDEEI